MDDKILLLKKDGTLVPHTDPKNIGQYFSVREYIFQQNLKRYGKLIVCEELMRVLDLFRKRIDEPITVTSFNRSQEKQDELNEDPRYKAATFSPHVKKLAADIVPYSIQYLHQQWQRNEGNVRSIIKILITNYYVKALEEVAKKAGIKIRIGFNQYLNNNQSFIHVDVCPEYYEKGRVWYNEPHPSAWSYEARW